MQGQFILLESEEKDSLSLPRWVSPAGIRGSNGTWFGLVDSISHFKRPQETVQTESNQVVLSAWSFLLPSSLPAKVFVVPSSQDLAEMPPPPGSLPECLQVSVSPSLPSLTEHWAFISAAGIPVLLYCWPVFFHQSISVSAYAGLIVGTPVPAPLRRPLWAAC